MDRNFCPLCNRIVAYGDHHTCFDFENNENGYILPHVEESNKREQIKDDAKERIQENSNDFSRNVRPEVPQTERENSAVPIMPASLNIGICETFSEKNSNSTGIRNRHDASFLDSTLNDQTNENHSQRNASLKASTEIDEPSCISGIEFHESDERTLYDTGNEHNVKKKYEPNISHENLGISNERRDKPLEESKLLSLKNDIDYFMYFLNSVNKKVPCDKAITSTELNLITGSDIPSINKKRDNNMIQESEREHDSPELVSESAGKNEEMSTNDYELLYLEEKTTRRLDVLLKKTCMANLVLTSYIRKVTLITGVKCYQPTRKL